MSDLKNIIRQAIDIHMHIGPEPIPRKYTVQSLVDEEQGNIGGCVLKNHFYPTMPFIKEIKETKGLKLFGGLVLNNAIGGLNPNAIYASSLLSTSPIMVWFPTINARNFLKKSDYEIAPEWVNNKNFTAKKSQNVKPVDVVINNKLTEKAIEVLRAIKECRGVLATGHISWEESQILVDKSLELGIKNIVITHPIYQKIAMPISIQKELANKGCFIEIPYSMYSIDGISLEQIVEQIKAINPKNIILSSDVGQSFSLSPSKSLTIFAEKLVALGISLEDVSTMLVANPKKLLDLGR